LPAPLPSAPAAATSVKLELRLQRLPSGPERAKPDEQKLKRIVSGVSGGQPEPSGYAQAVTAWQGTGAAGCLHINFTNIDQDFLGHCGSRWTGSSKPQPQKQTNLKNKLVNISCRVQQVDPYEAEVDWFTRDLELHPLSSAPEPKRRFQPSKWEEKKCASVPCPGHSLNSCWQISLPSVSEAHADAELLTTVGTCRP